MAHLRSLRHALSEETIAGGADPLPSQVIKSAGRALQILELFDVLQRRATLMEIAELLQYPQSSTTMLVRSLVIMGYLSYDSSSRTYITSPRVPLLGKWLSSTLVGDGHVTNVMRRINERTGQGVVLATRNDLMSQYIHVIQATAAVRLFLVQGTNRPLIRSGTGYALLSGLSDDRIIRIAMRVNAEGGVNNQIVRHNELLDTIHEVRQNGYAVTTKLVTLEGGMLAMPLPQWLVDKVGQPAVIGIGAAASVIAERTPEFLEALREELVQSPSEPK